MTGQRRSADITLGGSGTPSSPTASCGPSGSPTSCPACSRASSPAAGPASRPPTTGPGPRPSCVAAGVRPHRGHRRRAAAAVPGLPQAALGAVVISAVLGFLNLAAMERVRRLRHDSFVLALVILVAVLVLGVLQGSSWAWSSRRGLPDLGQSTQQLGPDRAGAARLPAERAAAVRQRQAPPRRHPGGGARRRHPGPGRPARPVVHPRARERERARLAAVRAGGPGRRPVAGRGPRPGTGHAGHGEGQARSASAGGSGSRRTSTSSRPRAWMRSSSP
jgi:hypothetical protein